VLSFTSAVSMCAVIFVWVAESFHFFTYLCRPLMIPHVSALPINTLLWSHLVQPLIMPIVLNPMCSLPCLSEHSFGQPSLSLSLCLSPLLSPFLLWGFLPSYAFVSYCPNSFYELSSGFSYSFVFHHFLAARCVLTIQYNLIRTATAQGRKNQAQLTAERLRFRTW